MLRFSCLILFLCIAAIGYSQSPWKEMHPMLGRTPDLTPAAQRRLERRDELFDKEYNKKQKLSPKEQAELDSLVNEFDETTETIWDVIGGGCSWYCAGGPYEVVASSELDTNYSAGNAHDLSLEFAWVEGAKGHGIGEFLEYYFANESPRINQINIYNGYIKNETAWKNNARVKKLKLYVNDEPFAILNLADTTALQSFDVPLLGRRPDKQDLVLRFEIAEVYPGLKHKDTVITEIFFDGTDDH